MDLAKAKILLDKINALFNSISSDAGNIAAIEKDLMRNYVQQLYEAILEEGNTAAPAAPKPAPAKRKEKVEIIKVEEKTPPRKAPRVIEIPDSLKEEVKATPPPPPPPQPEPVVETPPPPPPAPKPKPKPSPKPISSGNDDLDALFEAPKAKELSDKLSELPISDLTKAMGLNEKILTINELFNGDQELFNKTVQDLNGMSGFPEARNYLISGVAADQDWGEKVKQKKAKVFIKLVRRRYQ